MSGTGEIVTKVRWPHPLHLKPVAAVALALYFFHYNFCRQHKSLRAPPAMAADVTDELLSMEHLCRIMDEANPPKKRGPY